MLLGSFVLPGAVHGFEQQQMNEVEFDCSKTVRI
jgi:hypothetical protein